MPSPATRSRCSRARVRIPCGRWPVPPADVVAPAPVNTPMTASQTFEPEEFPMGRAAEADEVAGPLAFLVTPAAGYVSGVVLDITGAMFFS